MKDKQIVERDPVFCLLRHPSSYGVGRSSDHSVTPIPWPVQLILTYGCLISKTLKSEQTMNRLHLVGSSAADMHHGTRRFKKSGFTDMMTSFFALNGTEDIVAQFPVVRSFPQAAVEIVLHL